MEEEGFAEVVFQSPGMLIFLLVMIAIGILWLRSRNK